jgi:hypothetical protein
MKNGNWIALHKELKYFLPHGRSYTLLEAVFSYTLDIDNGKEGTISGYSKLWGWSRTKVRKLVEELKTVEGHLTNRQETGKRHHILLKLNNLQSQKDSRKTDEKQLEDSQVDTTIKPNPKPNPKPIKTFSSDSTEYRLSELLFNEILKRNPNHKKPNLQTWSKDIDKLIRIDGKSRTIIRDVIIWCQQDHFWQNNILCPTKLREKFDQLILKMNSKPTGFKTRTQRNAEAKEEVLREFQQSQERDITP